MSGRLILASASPRRRRLLSAAGLAFAVEPPGVDEGTAPGLPPEQVARDLARRKARAVAARHAGSAVWTIGADTVVAVGDELLGKPRDAADARRMLELLSASRHLVATGVCVVACADGVERAEVECTRVTMRAIRPPEVEAYVASGEWRGKAGGYAIQETADAFVTGLEEGGFDNVVGLPVALTLRLLAQSGALDRSA